ncbi:unnamed protein product, partial [Polarella glacialis]
MPCCVWCVIIACDPCSVGISLLLLYSIFGEQLAGPKTDRRLFHNSAAEAQLHGFLARHRFKHYQAPQIKVAAGPAGQLSADAALSSCEQLPDDGLCALAVRIEHELDPSTP